MESGPAGGDEDRMPGIVQVVRLPNAVAVVAEGTFWRAKQALAKLHPD